MLRRFLKVSAIVLAAAVLLGALLIYVGSLNAGKGDLPNYRKVSTGIYAGARPTEKGVDFLHKSGVRTIVNLEGWTFIKDPKAVQIERQWAEERGMKLVRVPMTPLLCPSDAKLEQAVSIISDKSNQPVYIHCRQGRDRTGLVVGVYRVVKENWSPEQAYQEMKEHGFHSGRYFLWKRKLAKFAESRGVH